MSRMEERRECEVWLEAFRTGFHKATSEAGFDLYLAGAFAEGYADRTVGRPGPIAKQTAYGAGTSWAAEEFRAEFEREAQK